MIGLVLKDLLNAKKNYKQLAIMIIPFTIFAYMLKSPMYISMMTLIFVVQILMTSFSYDEYSHWDNYAVTFPITKKQVVQSKYILLIVTNISGIIIGEICCLIVCILLKENIFENIVGSVATAFVLMGLYSIVIPICYKVGIEKARLSILAVFFIPAAIFYLVFKYADIRQIEVFLDNNLKLLAIASIIAIILIMYISYLISVKVFQDKDM